MPTTVPSHITIDDKGVARIEGTRFKVIHLIEAWKSGANTAAALHEAYPHLTMAQIHAALAYYYDHMIELDAQIHRELKEANEIMDQFGETPDRKRLRDVGPRS
ncbi:MAG TPA: DUF433 domain-containing protein [Tepidisphaeraceae bacterium]|nr:DUF433 domain-containing protein [Tepidisphaeraceae bacterium]